MAVTITKEQSVASFVDQDRLWHLLMDVARYGATEKGGVNRQALSLEDRAARSHVAGWAAARGFQAMQDDIGNLFVRREGRDASLPPVMTGSHLDSQPTGGKFDGAYGVLAGLEVLHALEDSGIQTRRAIEVVAWTNEEGSRFSPGAMGSSIFAGVRSLASVLDAADRNGVVLRTALEETLRATPIKRRERGAVHSYVEAHIEQGPILEEKGLEIGVVTGIQGVARLSVDVTGEEAHAGTTPRRVRKDAFAAAVQIISALQDLTRDKDDILRFTVGRCEVSPGSPNTVPGRAHFTIDLRHPDDAVMRSIKSSIRETALGAAGACLAEVKEISYVPPTIFGPKVVDIVRRSAAALDFRRQDIASGAGHDAMHLSKVCPSGMIFIPCLRGISHNEAESATPKQIADGARVLADTLLELAQE